MKGFRTLAFNAALVGGTAVLTWASGVDWTQYVSPSVAVIVIAGINVALRLITTSPVGTK